jgi:hypothetical protein
MHGAIKAAPGPAATSPEAAPTPPQDKPSTVGADLAALACNTASALTHTME